MKNTLNVKHTAIATCRCGNYLVSTGGGRFVLCPDCECFIDQERGSSQWVRLGGTGIKFIEQICPATCEHKHHDHTSNSMIDTIEALKKYMKKTYDYRI